MTEKGLRGEGSFEYPDERARGFNRPRIAIEVLNAEVASRAPSHAVGSTHYDAQVIAPSEGHHDMRADGVDDRAELALLNAAIHVCLRHE
jgi:hypothetical protein